MRWQERAWNGPTPSKARLSESASVLHQNRYRFISCGRHMVLCLTLALSFCHRSPLFKKKPMENISRVLMPWSVNKLLHVRCNTRRYDWVSIKLFTCTFFDLCKNNSLMQTAKAWNVAEKCFFSCARWRKVPYRSKVNAQKVNGDR